MFYTYFHSARLYDGAPFICVFFSPCPSTKVLLLGAGESGKSTFGKQLKMLNKGALADREKAIYRKGEEGLD